MQKYVSSMLAAPFSAMVSTIQQHACLGQKSPRLFLWGFEDACDLKRYDTNIDTYTPPPLSRPLYFSLQRSTGLIYRCTLR